MDPAVEAVLDEYVRPALAAHGGGIWGRGSGPFVIASASRGAAASSFSFFEFPSCIFLLSGVLYC